MTVVARWSSTVVSVAPADSCSVEKPSEWKSWWLKRPWLKPEEQPFWVAPSRVWQGWRSPLAFVKPATVVDWHLRGFRRYWRWRSRKPGRPRIPAEHITLIRRMSTDQPGWGEDRIADELAIKLGIRHSTSTIRRYMVRRREPRGREGSAT